jgi:hypothetical protein
MIGRGIEQGDGKVGRREVENEKWLRQRLMAPESFSSSAEPFSFRPTRLPVFLFNPLELDDQRVARATV